MSLLHQVTECGVCEKTALDLLWDLPKLPLTEKYGTFDPHHTLYQDQKLLLCKSCGHVQLETQISPSLLYTPSDYLYRVSKSFTAMKDMQVFIDFFHELSQNKTFHSLLDVGGNDLYLANSVKIAKKCVIDPVCAPQDGQMIDGVKMIGRFIESIDFQKEDLCPDLIFCRHVLEHIAKPKELLLKLFQECHPDALYIFEIPCFENLMEANRFDAIFHQHYHYFDLKIFQRLILEVGGEYISHTYNLRGPCGGALLIAFKKAKVLMQKGVVIDTVYRQKEIVHAIQNYQQQMRLLSDQLKRFSKNIYGFGASLMLATLGYHLDTDFSELICVLDDDPSKDQMGYENIPVQIRYTGNCNIDPKNNYLITSLENTRSIYKRLLDLTPRRVLFPLVG